MLCKAKKLQEETKITFQTNNKTDPKDARLQWKQLKFNFKLNENGSIPT
jgi:hypothetical protein